MLAPIFRLRLPQKRSSDVFGFPDDAGVTRRDDVDRVFVERDFVRSVDSAEMKIESLTLGRTFSSVTGLGEILLLGLL
jgi:hypothetical protein